MAELKALKMNDPFKHNDSSVKTDSPNSESQNFNETTETSQQTIKNKKFHYVERKKKISQDHQSSPSINSVSKTVNIFYQQSRGIIAFSIIILIIATIAFWFVPGPTGPPSPFFKKFADTTNNILTDVSKVELPAANTIMEHTVSCRRAANKVQRSIAFEAYGVQIAEGLRSFGDQIKDAGYLLKKMYSKGSSVYASFDIEIEAMMSRLSSKHRQLGDAKYFKERLNSLITKIKEFRKLVGETHQSIVDAETIRNNAEGYIVDGLREAGKFVAKNKCHSAKIDDENCHSVKVAKDELETVNSILVHLYKTADHLNKMEGILREYEDKLMDVSAELNGAGNAEDDIFEVTKADLKFLKLAIDNSKACLYKFKQLSG